MSYEISAGSTPGPAALERMMMFSKLAAKKNKSTFATEIRRGRPTKEITHRQTLPGVRVLDFQYKKIVQLAKKQKQTLSATIRGLLDEAL